MRRALGILVFLACATPARAFSVLGHRIIAQRVLADIQQHPGDYDPFLARVANDALLTQYFLAGTEAPDLGALPSQHPAIQYSTHYEHPGLWAKTLFTTATTDAERAYAWGWIVHLGADRHLHAWMEAQGLNYCDAPLAHVVFEAAMDAVVAHAYAAQGAFTNTRRSTHATRLLLTTTTIIANNSVPPTPGYAAYLATLHHRCTPRSLAPSTGITTSWQEVDAAGTTFDLVKTLQLAGATAADETQRLAQELRTISTNATSPFARAFAARLASALGDAHPLLLAGFRTADNAELVGLYGFAAGPIRQALEAARTGDWDALDRNLDTGAPVHDPALASRGAWYRFDEGSGTSALDSSGAGNHASISGPTYTTGYSGTGLRFAMPQDRVVVPAQVFAGFGSTAYFEAWIRPTAYPASGCTGVLFRKIARFNDWWLSLGSDGRLTSVLYDATARSGQHAIATGGTVPLNAWTKVASWYDGTTLRVLVNDSEVAHHDRPQALDWTKNYVETQLGNTTTTGECAHFSGDIDEVAIASAPTASHVAMH